MNILIVEDDVSTQHFISKVLVKKGMHVTLCGTLAQAREQIDSCDAVLCDCELPDGTGEQLLQLAMETRPQLGFYFATAFGTVQRAVTALKGGARDFVEKPLSEASLEALFKTLQKSNSDFEGQTSLKNTGLVYGAGSPLEETLKLTRVLSSKNCPVYIRGESGTGKECFARLLHQLGPREKQPFVAINCASLNLNLMEGELFGYKRGAFTGANSDRVGVLEQAEGGTLFLDEVGELPLAIQAKLLRALQEKSIRRIGESQERFIDFRLVCATHRNLAESVAKGEFREDLFFRLNVMELGIAPLRERRMDIPLLVNHFLMSNGLPPENLPTLPELFFSHPFPGNVRELKNWVDRYGVQRELGKGWKEALSQGQVFSSGLGTEHTTDFMPQRIEMKSPRIKDSRKSDEKILEALERYSFHRENTAEALGMSRRALQYRIARLKSLVQSGL